MRSPVTDFNIRAQDHPSYVDDILTYTSQDALILRIEVCLLTNPGEVFGSPELGVGLRKYLFTQRSIPIEVIIRNIKEQFSLWLPEISGRYTIEGTIYPPGVIHDGAGDAFLIDITIDGNKFIYLV